MSDGAFASLALKFVNFGATLRTVPPDQFQKGLQVILAALNQGLSGRGVQAATVSHDDAGTQEQPVTFVVSVAGKEITETFSRDEIIDSGEAIDAPAAQKVRTLVSHLIPQNSAPQD